MRKEVRGSEQKWEECVWVWDYRPIEGSSCGVLNVIQQMWERREGFERVRERERNISTHPTRRHTHKQQADRERVRKTQDLRAAAVQTARQTQSFTERRCLIKREEKSHRHTPETETLTNKYSVCCPDGQEGTGLIQEIP